MQSKGLSRVFSNATVQKHQFFSTQFSLEKEMATHSIFLPGQSHEQRSLVGYGPWGRTELDMTEQLHFQFSLSTFMHWRRKWQPTPVFLPEESHGQRSLVGCCLWGRTESDTTEAMSRSSKSSFFYSPALTSIHDYWKNHSFD